ncbi:MAG: YitT family protein [Clostridia bacterium]|nr:YitT family protein [Clostridia bacterium]
MKKIKSYLVILLGVILASFGIGMFCIPNKIVGGGVSGVSTVLYYLFKIPAGISYFAFNILFLIIGLKKLSKGFIIKTIICAGLMSFLIDVFLTFPPITDDVVLASLFGGVIYGVGIGLTLISDASTGGTDILGRIIQYMRPHIEIGKIFMIIDLIIIAFSFMVFGEVDLSLYGVLSLYISTTAIDLLVHKLNVSKLVFVISEKGESVAKKLIEECGRGVTIIDAVGAYTMKEKNMLICAMKENEMPEFQRNVMSVDEDAFIVATESQKIFGKGFYVYH